MSHTKTKNSNNRGSNSLLSVLLCLLLIGASLALWLNRQYVLDFISFKQYTPTSEIESIARRTTMNDSGTFYFYASKPSIEGARTFNTVCQRREESSAILGCYANNRIFVYDITDARLDGIKEVTAAHEMLHAAYQRLPENEKQRVNALLEKEYAKLQQDENLSERMAFYARTEAGERSNELHSIVGTEILNVGDELEQHYARYFTDRRAVASMYVEYAGVFNDLKEKSTNLSERLKTLGRTIEHETAQYNQQVRDLNADIQQFNTRASGDYFTNRADFDRERNALMARVASTTATLSAIKTDISTYEALREEYNAIASTSNELYKSIDSKLAPAPSV